MQFPVKCKNSFQARYYLMSFSTCNRFSTGSIARRAIELVKFTLWFCKNINIWNNSEGLSKGKELYCNGFVKQICALRITHALHRPLTAGLNFLQQWKMNGTRPQTIPQHILVLAVSFIFSLWLLALCVCISWSMSQKPASGANFYQTQLFLLLPWTTSAGRDLTAAPQRQWEQSPPSKVTPSRELLVK